MQIQWFPGHMHKARKEIKKVLSQVDIIIEILDARIPFSSENPIIAEFRQAIPGIKILNKCDLADPRLTEIWQDYFESELGIRTLATRTDKPEEIRRISSLCRRLIPTRSKSFRPVHTMIMGIPNVGKSTLINILAGSVVAKTGNQAAVTKGPQKIKLDNGINLSDTPGILWPNLENKNTGYRLALTGAIRDTAIDYSDIALFAIDFFLHNYPKLLKNRYRLDHMPASEIEVLELIGKKRGCLVSGGAVDYDKASKLLINDFRSGLIGSVTLETPDIMHRELAELEILRQQKADRKKAGTRTGKKKK